MKLKYIIGTLITFLLSFSVAFAVVSLPSTIKKGDLMVGSTTTNSIYRLPTSTLGSILWMNSNGLPSWTATSTLGISGGTGLSNLNGLVASTQTFASGTPPTGIDLFINSSVSTHTFRLGLQAGYNIPLSASTTEWSNFYITPSTRITAGTNLSWSGNTLNGIMASSTIIAGGIATHSPSITIATSTDTNLGIQVVCATSTCTFTPQWTGLLSVTRGGTGANNLTTGAVLFGNGTSAVGTSTNFSFTSASNTLTLTGTSTVSNSILIGTTTLTSPFVQGQTPLAMQGTINNYFETNIQNKSNGTLASTDYTVTADNGTATTYYANFGINSSGFTKTSELSGTVNDAYLTNSDGSLIIATASTTNSNALLKFVSRGTIIATGTQAGLQMLNASTTGLTVTGASFLQNATLSGTLNVTGQTTLGNASTSALSVSGISYHTGLMNFGSASGTSLSLSGSLYTNIQSGTQCLQASANGLVSGTGSACGAGGSGTVSGGLTGFVTTWASSTGLTYGTLRDNGTVSGVNATSSTVNFLVQGTGSNNAFQINSSTGSTMFQITPTGNVGIGTTTPANRFVIDSGTASVLPNIQLSAQGGSSQYIGNAGTFITGASNTDLGFLSSGKMYFGASGNTTAIMTLTGGNVGIGSNTPISTVAIQGSGSTFPLIVASSTGTQLLSIAPNGSTTLSSLGTGCVGVSSGSLFTTPCGSGSISGSGTNGYVARWSSTSALANGVTIDNGTVAGVNASSSTVSFNVQGTTTLDPFNVSSSTGTSILRVTATGRIGIGTTTPNANLTLQATSGQTANLFTLASSSGASLFNVSSVGATSINTSATSSSAFLITNPTGQTNLQVDQTAVATGLTIGTTTTSSLYTAGSIVVVGSTSSTTMPYIYVASSSSDSIFRVSNSATTTVQIDTPTTKGMCLKLKDADGTGYTYVTANNGALTASTGSCE